MGACFHVPLWDVHEGVRFRTHAKRPIYNGQVPYAYRKHLGNVKQ